VTDGPSAICVDNIVLVRVLTGTARPETIDEWVSWEDSGRRLVAPSLMHFELCNALHQYTRVGQISAETVGELIADALAMPIEIVDDDRLHMEALAAAERFGIASVYDAHYLALAERRGIDLVTADAALHRRVTAAAPWVRLME